MIPNDPMILLSYVNTKLRDSYSSLDEMCDDLQIDRKELEQKLEAVDYGLRPYHLSLIRKKRVGVQIQGSVENKQVLHKELKTDQDIDTEINKEDLARSFQDVAVDQLIRKSELAIKKYNIKNMVIAGGVSANKQLREELKKLADKYEIDLTIPSFVYCTDNAAMIGAAAYPLFKQGKFAGLDLNATSCEEIY